MAPPKMDVEAAGWLVDGWVPSEKQIVVSAIIEEQNRVAH
jgi:hypothetical protein